MILILEDSKAQAAVLESQCRDRFPSWEIRIAHTLEEFTNLFWTTPPVVVISDITMPTIEPVALIHSLKVVRDAERIAVIFYSGSEYGQLCDEYDLPFFSKDCGVDYMLDYVEDVCSGTDHGTSNCHVDAGAGTR